MVAQAGHPGGWVALLLTLGVAVAYAGRTLAPRGLSNLLVRSRAGRWCPGRLHRRVQDEVNGNWLAYHILTASWAILGVAPSLA